MAYDDIPENPEEAVERIRHASSEDEAREIEAALIQQSDNRPQEDDPEVTDADG